MSLTIRLSVAVLACAMAGCASHATPVVTPQPQALPIQPIGDIGAPPVPLAPDPIAAAIADAEAAFDAGQRELALGHLDGARQRFDQAVEGLLHAPGGARGEPRLAAEFDRLLDRINALQALALHEADSAAPRSEPAAIDALLAVATLEPPHPAASTAEMVAADLAATRHDIPIPINDKILGYVEQFQGGLRTFLEDGLERGSRYLPMILDVFRQEKVPLDLVYVPLIESAFKPNAVSRAAARGIWQFELGTAKDYGLHQNWFVDERSDPEKATRAAAQHLKMLNEMFDGDWNLTLAAYNVGQGFVVRAMKKSGLTDYWKLSATSKYLPRDTREYVPMILASIIIARNPAQYGFDAGVGTSLAYERVTVPDALDLRVIAEWTGVAIEQIQELNPELRRGITPLGSHALKVPLGTAATVETKLLAADPSIFASTQQFQAYVVKAGDTLASIARKFKVNGGTRTLAAVNSLDKSRITTNQTLMIPRQPATSLASSTARPAAPAATYQVKPGDTLSSIARRFEVTVADLKRLNQLSTDTIIVGDRLTVRR